MATQLMANDAVTVDGKLTNIRQSSRNKYFEAIQNPEKPSMWFHEI
jgi:hypothetical protein